MEKTWIFILEESQPELHSSSQFKKAWRHFKILLMILSIYFLYKF